MQFNIFTSIIIYLIPVILCVLAYKLKNKYFIFAFLAFTFLMLAFRYNIAIDYGRYYNRAFYRTELGISFNEPIEMLFFFISSKAGLPRLFFMLNSAVVTICGYILYLQYKNQKRYELLFITYYLLVLVASFITRYCTAVAVCSVGVYFLVNYTKHKIYILYYLLIALLSFCFHTGAIVTIAFPFLLILYDLIKREKGILKYSYTIMMGFIGILLPLAEIFGDFIFSNIKLFDKFTLYFELFKECIPNNIFMIILMVLLLCAFGFLFDILSITFSKNKYFKVFSIGSLIFTLFMVIPFFREQYLIDVMRIGAVFGFQSIILFGFIFLNKETHRDANTISKIIISVISATYICIIIFCFILGSSYILPYNTDTTVPWGSDSTYIQKAAE